MRCPELCKRAGANYIPCSVVLLVRSSAHILSLRLPSHIKFFLIRADFASTRECRLDTLTNGGTPAQTMIYYGMARAYTLQIRGCTIIAIIAFRSGTFHLPQMRKPAVGPQVVDNQNRPHLWMVSLASWQASKFFFQFSAVPIVPKYKSVPRKGSVPMYKSGLTGYEKLNNSVAFIAQSIPIVKFNTVSQF